MTVPRQTAASPATDGGSPILAVEMRDGDRLQQQTAVTSATGGEILNFIGRVPRPAAARARIRAL